MTGYTKQMALQFERMKTNKIYTNIMAFASGQPSDNEPIPASLEAEYQSDLVLPCKQLGLQVTSLKSCLDLMTSNIGREAKCLKQISSLFISLECQRDKTFDLSIDQEDASKDLNYIDTLHRKTTSLYKDCKE